jgi:hypothetical protein
MFTYNKQEVLKSLVIDSSHYERTEEWDKFDNVMELFKFVNKNAVDGMITLTEEQRDVYLCGECNDVRYYETAVDSY